MPQASHRCPRSAGRRRLRSGVRSSPVRRFRIRVSGRCRNSGVMTLPLGSSSPMQRVWSMAQRRWMSRSLARTAGGDDYSLAVPAPDHFIPSAALPGQQPAVDAHRSRTSAKVSSDVSR
jgi:hypothetical protein